MSDREKQLAQQSADDAILQLSREDNFIHAQMQDYRVVDGYCEPKIRLTNEYGEFEAWLPNGESMGDMQWEEV